MRTLIYYVSFWGYLLFSALFILWMGILRLLGRSQQIPAYASRRAIGWGRTMVRLSGGDIQFEGAENIPSEGGFVVCSNHQGAFDIPLVVGFLPRPIGFVAKIELPNGEALGLPCSELFPQTGPFSEAAHKGRGGESRQHDDKPMRHAKRKQRASTANKDRLAKLVPGEKVYVVPFRTMATLVRLDVEKGKAVVLHGAFEMEVKLDDVEPSQRPGRKG